MDEEYEFKKGIIDYLLTLTANCVTYYVKNVKLVLRLSK